MDATGGFPIPTRITDRVYALGPLGRPKTIAPYLHLSERPTIVDCGPSSVVEGLLEELHSVGVEPREIAYIAVTHVHTDHAGGAWKAMEQMENAKLLVPEKGVKHIVDPSRLILSAREVLGPVFDLWGEVRGVSPDRVIAVRDGDKFEIGGDTLTYIGSYGHAPHHMVILDGERNLFCGDALGIYHEECGLITPTTPPPSFDYEESIRDIEKIRQLRPLRVLLPHYTYMHFSASLVNHILEVYREWHDTILKATVEGAPEHAATRLLERFPEYARCIAPEMLEQIKRIDVGGFLSYFEKKSKMRRVG